VLSWWILLGEEEEEEEEEEGWGERDQRPLKSPRVSWFPFNTGRSLCYEVLTSTAA